MEISATKTPPAEAGEGARKTEKAHWPDWVSLAALLVTLITLIGGGLYLTQERTAKTEWQGAGQEKRVDDHEARLRKLEDVTTGIAVKVDLIYQKLNK